MLAFTGCDKIYKTISGLQNEAEVKEVLNDKPDVKEVVKAEHYTVGDALHFAVSSYFSFQKTAIKISLATICIFAIIGSGAYLFDTYR